MKRVLLTQKDYPENFNKLAKYIAKNWTNRQLQFEESRQLLAKIIGYNSIHELERTFVKKLPNLIDIDDLFSNIKYKISELYKEDYVNNSKFGNVHILDLWGAYETNIFEKIPFYLLAALNRSAENIFTGVYDAVANRHSLFITDRRYGGGYYGMFLPYVDRASDIDDAIEGDKTENLIDFFREYECFAFSEGQSHISVITQLKDRVEKYFDENGEWKIKIYHPDYENPDDCTPMLYFEVLDEILSWFKSYGEWNVVDTKKKEKHWLLEKLDNAIKELQDNNYEKVEKIQSTIEDTVHNSNSEHRNINCILDESASFQHSTGVFEKMAMSGRLQAKPTKEEEVGILNMFDEPIYIYDRLKDKDGRDYRVCKYRDSEDIFLYATDEPGKILELKDYDKKLIPLNCMTQNLSDI